MNAQNHTYNLKESHREFYALKKLKPYARKKYIFPPINNIEDFPEVVIMKKLSHPNILELKGIAQYDKGYELNHYLVIDFGIELLEFVKHKEISLSK